VPDVTAILHQLEKHGVPVGLDMLAASLNLSGERERKALKRRLQRLVAEGRLLLNRRGEYCLLTKIDAVTGAVSAHRDGYGFLTPDDGSPDIYLPFAEMRQLLDGDRAAVRVAGRAFGDRPSGAVVEILARGRQVVVGRYRREHGIGYVVETGRSPHHFIVPDHQRGGAAPGQLVKLEITTYPSATREAQGKVVRILGDPAENPGVAADAALEIFGIRSAWSSAVQQAAAACSETVRTHDKRHREDLCDVPLVTIDGEDARDFDDAVFAETRADGWRLVVAIADVAHYVRPGDALDEEARRRGTSVYFPDRVVPMLPENLSNGLCSLNPAVDRLCMVCDMSVSARGEVRKSRFYRGVMRSHGRLTYAEVQGARDGSAGMRQRLRTVWPRLEELYGLYRALANARSRRGALDLDLPEMKVELGSHGRIERISLRERNDAHRLIEECMIAANVEAARLLRARHLPALYRVHARPDPEKFENLRLMLQAIGLRVSDQAQSRTSELNRILRSIRQRPDYPMLATAVLRTMAQAVYQPANTGHFGLALPAYTHFTSPIRRYPDLLVHRGIGHVIDQGKPAAFAYDIPALDTMGRVCSDRERRADEAARYVQARYKCTYIKDHIGADMDGVVTGITHFGLFVTLRELNVDGLVHVTNLPNDYYHVEHGGLRLTGERSGTSFGLGEPLRVRVVRVDVDEAKIDLMLVDDLLREPARGSRRRRVRH
jgi:ribonuclease R